MIGKSAERGSGKWVTVGRGGDIRREYDREVSREREWEMGDGRERGRYKERV